MAGVYKEKECPHCGIKHRKRGKYCSASHAQLGRKHSAETKEKIAEKAKERFEDREGDAYLNLTAYAQDASSKSKGIVRDPVPPRQHVDRPGEVIDGDLWLTEDEYF